MATIEEVARRAGVATSTVSFVMNQNPRVSEETRQLVLNAAKELNYTLAKKGRPRRAEGARLYPRRRNMIGLLYPFSEASLGTNITYMTLIQGAKAVAQKAGQDLVVLAMEKRASAVSDLRLDGAIAIMSGQFDRYEALAKKLPLVRAMGAPSDDAPWDQVTYNSRAIGVLAARHLLEQGHRRCAYLSPFANHPRPEQIPFCQQKYERETLFIQTIQSAGGTVRVNEFGLTQDVTPMPDLLARMVESIVMPEPRPTAIFVPADQYTPNVYAALYALGIRPGIDMDVISCNNDLPLLQSLHPRPAVVDLHIPAIGAASIEQLLFRIDDPDRPVGTLQFAPTIIPATKTSREHHQN